MKVVSFLITKPFEEESAEYIWGIFNANAASVMLDSPKLDKKKEEPWIIYVDEKKSGIVPLRLFHEKKIMVPARSAIILCK